MIKTQADALQAELAALKREHAQLRAAAERAWSALADCPNDGSTTHYKLSWRKNAHDVERLLAAALDATPAEPAPEFTIEQDPTPPLDQWRQQWAAFQVAFEHAVLGDRPAWDQSDGVECPNCGGNATLCAHDGLAESVRETFDPDAVRELLGALPRSSNPGWIEKLAQYVRDSERKP